MDREAIKCNYLEQMLLDANKDPIDLPLSLLEAITDNFSEDKKIGSGGFADVYEGFLGNSLIAVKKLSPLVDLDEINFNREVSSLISVKHKNIVRFLGYCADTQGKVRNYDGKTVLADARQRLLCFEYLPNKGLDKHISDASRGLEWRTRYQIIKGICDGLHYLHQQNIVHLDLKPANILLDSNMVPKIADFGLAKFFDANQTQARTKNVVGTAGYMAPEMYSGVITFKSDIYSLGIIITEILTGQKGYLHIENVVESWRAKFKMSQEGIYLEHVRVCAEMGFKCMDPDPEKRPMAEYILEMLHELECTYSFSETGLPTTHVHPLQVGFPWETNRHMECPVTLTNGTDDEVAVWIAPSTDPDTPCSKDGFPYVWEPLSSIIEKSSTFLRVISPHTSVVIFMSMREQRQRPLIRPSAGMLDVRMFTLKGRPWPMTCGQEHVAATDPVLYKMLLEAIMKRVEEGTEVYRATLRVVAYDGPQRFQRAETKFIPAARHIYQTFRSMDVHPRETWVLVGDSKGYVSIWNYEMEERVMEFQVITGDRNIIRSTKFVAGEQWFAAGDEYGSVHVYAYTTKDKVKEFSAHHESVDMLAVHPTDTFLLTATSSSKWIKLWDWAEGWTCVRQFDACMRTRVHDITFGPKETSIFACLSTDGVKVWDYHSSDPVAISEGDGCIRFNLHSDNNRHFITAFHSFDKKIKTRDLQTLEEVQTLIIEQRESWHTSEGVQTLIDTVGSHVIACHPTLPILASVRGKSIFLWDTTRTCRLVKRFELPDKDLFIFRMVFVGTEDLTRLLVGTEEWISTFKINLPGLLTSIGN